MKDNILVFICTSEQHLFLSSSKDSQNDYSRFDLVKAVLVVRSSVSPTKLRKFSLYI